MNNWDSKESEIESGQAGDEQRVEPAGELEQEQQFALGLWNQRV